MKQIAFIDMDDTLLGPTKSISTQNLRALDRLRAADVEIVIASGRHRRNITGYQAEIGDLDWMISSHGAVVESLRTGEVLHEFFLPASSIPDICRRGREEGVGLMVYHRTGIYTEEITEWIALHASRIGQEPVVRDFSTIPADEFQKVMWTKNFERISALASPLAKEFAGKVQVLRTEPELLEFFSTSVNKAVGAQALIARRGVPQSRTMAFGDGSNDIELLGWAGISVAMAHGHAAARQAAQYVTPPAPPETAFAHAVEIALRAMEARAGSASPRRSIDLAVTHSTML
jgi:Cof subfamily protein (haloacid dehalogenase superfamily)